MLRQMELKLEVLITDIKLIKSDKKKDKLFN